MEMIRQLLAARSMRLKGTDGEPIDIRDSSHERTMLGLIPVWTGDQLTLQIARSAYEDLASMFAEAQEYQWPHLTVERTVSGWIRSVGPALTSARETQIVVERVMALAHRNGFHELRRHELQLVTQDAHVDWQAIRSAQLHT